MLFWRVVSFLWLLLGLLQFALQWHKLRVIPWLYQYVTFFPALSKPWWTNGAFMCFCFVTFSVNDLNMSCIFFIVTAFVFCSCCGGVRLGFMFSSCGGCVCVLESVFLKPFVHHFLDVHSSVLLCHCSILRVILGCDGEECLKTFSCLVSRFWFASFSTISCK